MQVLESAKAHLEGGRADSVIAELGPVLLNEASVQGHGAFTTKQCILEGLQLLQAGPLLHMPFSADTTRSPKAYSSSFKVPGHMYLGQAETIFDCFVMVGDNLASGMQDAAVSQRDVACELKCRLVALRWLLPHIPADFDDDDAHTAPASGPPPAAMKDLQTPFKAIVTQVSGPIAPYLQYRAASHKCCPRL